MTVATPSHGRAFDRFLFRLAHWQAAVLVSLAVTDAGTYFIRRYPLWWWPPAANALACTFLALLLTFAVSMYAMVKHDRGLCVACGEDFPLDAQAQACGQRRLAMRGFHLFVDHLWFSFAVIGLILAADVNGFWWGPLVWVLFAGLVWAARWHRILGLYCPYCHRDTGGGGHLEPSAPTPDPAASVSR